MKPKYIFELDIAKLCKEEGIGLSTTLVIKLKNKSGSERIIQIHETYTDNDIRALREIISDFRTEDILRK